jgi:NAD(P) transhydrogenase subunit alpha
MNDAAQLWTVCCNFVATAAAGHVQNGPALSSHVLSSAVANRGSHFALVVVEVTILALAIFLGVEVISKVPTLLHTPLMSGTNAIHGIVIVGAILVAGMADPDLLTGWVGFIAMILAAANVVGGFVVTDRMLEMFKKREPRRPEEDGSE